MRASIVRVVADLRQVPFTQNGLVDFVKANPAAIPLLATCVDLTQEQLKNQLAHRFGTQSWTLLARTKPADLTAMLEDEFQLIERLTEQLNRQWSFEDVLLERFLWSRKGGAQSDEDGNWRTKFRPLWMQ